MNVYQSFFSLIGSRTAYLLYDKVRAMKITRQLRIFSVAISNFMRLSAVYVFISRNPCIIKKNSGFAWSRKETFKNLLEIFLFSRHFMMH